MQAEENKSKYLVWVVGVCALAALVLPVAHLPFSNYIMSRWADRIARDIMRL